MGTMIDGPLRIGELAARCGVSPHTIRFYERKKLLPRPRRAESRYRIYDQRDEGRVRFIRHAQEMGLTLRDIGELLRQRELRTPDECARVAVLLGERIEVLDRKIEQLRAFRRRLAENLHRCEGASQEGCPVVLSLAAPSATRKTERR